jgi:DHA1 family bicyclomycin/chloramphenicol resistance-like MFS transporter
VAGVAAYALLSLLIALAPSAPVLAGLRLLQGVAGGVGIVVARAIVRDLYSGAEAARFFSRLTLIFGVAPVLAPTLGSAVLRVTSWHGIFVALGLIAVVLTAALAVRLPETLPPQRRSTGGLAETAAAARTLFRDRVFLGYALTQALSLAALFVYLAGSSFVLQDGYGLSPTVYGLLFGLNAVGLIIVGQANARLVDRFPTRVLLLAALAVQTLSGALVLLSALLGNLAGLLAGLFLLIATIGMVPPNATALALDRHPDRAGTAAALVGGLQSAIAAMAAPLAGIGDPGGGVPMGALILAFAVAALLTVPLLTGERQRPRPAPLA